MHGQGPTRADTSRNLKDNICNFKQQPSPLGGEKPRADENVIQVRTLEFGNSQFFQGSASRSRRWRPKKPGGRRQGGVLGAIRPGNSMGQQTMTGGKPTLRSERSDCRVWTPGLEPGEERRVACMSGKVQRHVELQRIRTENPVRQKTPGKAVGPLLYHPSASHMDDVQAESGDHF